MSKSELKLEIFRLIDQQEDQTLKEIYQLLKNKQTIPLVNSYKEMAADQQREIDAEEWIEGLINDSEMNNYEE